MLDKSALVLAIHFFLYFSPHKFNVRDDRQRSKEGINLE